MSLAQRMHFLLDVSQMSTTALVSVINHYHINELYLFWYTLYVWDIKNKYGVNPILKREFVTRLRSYKAGDKFWLLYMGEKLVQATYLQAEELLNQKSKILNRCWHQNK